MFRLGEKMNKINKMKKLSPVLLILFSFLLLLVELALPAGVCFLIGFVLIVESIWPEKWEKDEEKY